MCLCVKKRVLCVFACDFWHSTHDHRPDSPRRILKLWYAKAFSICLLNHDLMWSCRRPPQYNREGMKNAFDFFFISLEHGIFSIAFQMCKHVPSVAVSCCCCRDDWLAHLIWAIIDGIFSHLASKSQVEIKRLARSKMSRIGQLKPGWFGTFLT